MRTILVHWLWQIAAQQKFSFRVFHLGVQYFDIYLASTRNAARATLQGYGIVALWIASKYDDIYSLSLADVVSLCDFAYTASDLASYEREMLVAIQFRLELPTPTLRSRSEELAAVLMCIDGCMKPWTRRIVFIASRRLDADGFPTTIRRSTRLGKKNARARIDVFERVVSPACESEVAEVVHFYAERRLAAAHDPVF